MKRLITILLLSIVMINIGTVLFAVYSHKTQTDKLFGIPDIAAVAGSVTVSIGIYFLAVILALYHIATNSRFTTTQKLLWFLLILLVHVLGLVAYLLWGGNMERENEGIVNS